jgi:negative regulator of flagellin synthesis FlgM
MRIDPNLQYLQNAQTDASQGVKGPASQQASATGSTPQTAETDSGDTVQISGRAGEVQQLMTQVSQTPDVRAQRVAALRQQIQQGTYQPTNEQLAGAVASEAFGIGGRI